MSKVIRSSAPGASRPKHAKQVKSGSAKTYLTAEVLERAVSKGIRQASINAMETAGSVVSVHEGWIVRKSKDGSMSRIKKLPKMSVTTFQTKTAKLAFK